MILKSTVDGRVLYRLAEEGEVLGSGGKVLTLVNLSDVYMEIYLPAQDAVKAKLGADARIVLDVAPEYAARAKVSFVAPEAQFTPKEVETRSERDKLMFRVKLSVPPSASCPSSSGSRPASGASATSGSTTRRPGPNGSIAPSRGPPPPRPRRPENRRAVTSPKAKGPRPLDRKRRPPDPDGGRRDGLPQHEHLHPSGP